MRLGLAAGTELKLVYRVGVGNTPLPLCSHNALCLCELCSAYSIFRDTVSFPPACRFLEAGAGSWLQGLESRGQDR